MNTFDKLLFTVKLGFKELLNKEQLGNSEPFSLTNMPVYLINSEIIVFSEQLCYIDGIISLPSLYDQNSSLLPSLTVLHTCK